MNLLRFTLAVLVAAALVGCGAPKPAAATADTTAACCDSATRAACCGSDSAGAICETTLDTAAGFQPEAPKREPMKKAEPAKPGELPRLWDFGSTTCVPCKTMLGILTPMMADYKGKVDIRIINVYEEKELAKQFRIVTIPTQVFLDADGKEFFRHIGVYPRDSIETKFREFGMPIITGAVTPTPASECLT